MYYSLGRRLIRPGNLSQGGSKRGEHFMRSGIWACLPFSPNVYCMPESTMNHDDDYHVIIQILW